MTDIWRRWHSTPSSKSSPMLFPMIIVHIYGLFFLLLVIVQMTFTKHILFFFFWEISYVHCSTDENQVYNLARALSCGKMSMVPKLSGQPCRSAHTHGHTSPCGRPAPCTAKEAESHSEMEFFIWRFSKLTQERVMFSNPKRNRKTFSISFLSWIVFQGV